MSRNSLLLFVAAAACCRSGLWMVVFNQAAMTDRAASMKGFSQAGLVIVLLSDVTFHTAKFFILDINEFAGLVVLHMMTNPTTFILQSGGMNFMGETDLRPS